MKLAAHVNKKESLKLQMQRLYAYMKIQKSKDQGNDDVLFLLLHPVKVAHDV